MKPSSFRPHTGPLRDLRQIFAQAVHKAILECSPKNRAPSMAAVSNTRDPGELQQIACVSPSRENARSGEAASTKQRGKAKKKRQQNNEDVVLGEYQCNAALKFAKQAKTRPQQLAQAIVDQILRMDANETPDIITASLASSLKLSVSGPGFINIRVSDHWLGDCASTVARRCYDSSRGMDYVPPTFRERTKNEVGRRVLIDFASPNMGKELHIGHMRSAVIGDVVANMHAYCGDTVSRVSHVGDWGMPTAIVTTAWLMEGEKEELPSPTHLTSLYRRCKRKLMDDTAKSGNPICDLQTRVDRVNDILQWCGEADWMEFIHNKNFQTAKEVSSSLLAEAKVRRSQLTSEQIETLVGWWAVCEASRQGHREIYDRLNVTVDEKGESRYASLVPPVVEELVDAKIACKSEGAIVVHSDSTLSSSSLSSSPKSDGSQESENREPPLLVRKSNGAHLYSTVDLAALRWRSKEAEQDLVLYVTDGGQALHFKQVFGVARRAGWLRRGISADCIPTHVPFGLVRDERGNKLSSRGGGNGDDTEEEGGRSNSLRQLLNDGMALVQERVIAPPSFEGNELGEQNFYDMLSSASIRYFDLQHQRTTNYNINFDAMLAARGNTAMYLMYTCARIHAMNRKVTNSSVFLHLAQDEEKCKEKYTDAFAAAVMTGANVSLHQVQERDLALRIAQFDDMLDISLNTYSPHVLCEYLHSLALAFNAFYESPDCRLLPKQRSDNAEDAPRSHVPAEAELAFVRSRLILCASAASTLHTGMQLIGIPVLDSVGFQQEASVATEANIKT